MLISCSKCGKVHNVNYKCKSERGPQTLEQSLRKRNKWTVKSKQIRERSLNICAVCKDRGTINFDDDLEVHHIKKLRDDPSGLLDDDNLICLCVYHHKQADRGELDVDYLLELVRQRDKDLGALL